jgi:small subunit ribosomal protein S13
MARIAGVEVPAQKPIWVSLQYVYGIGKTTALRIVEQAGIPLQKRTRELTEEQIARINDIIERNYMVEGALRRKVAADVQRLKDIRCYRGLRHIRGLPVRGQRTRSNARTRKGPRKTVAGKKIAKRIS